MSEQAADWRPLPEDVRFHAMLPGEPHEDGRKCWHHYRLGVWTFDGVHECLRAHPEPYAATRDAEQPTPRVTTPETPSERRREPLGWEGDQA
jgi:hypothetical protein